MPNIDDARKEAREREIGTFERHMFICTGPDCCSEKDGQRSWDHLKAAAAKVNKTKDAPKLYRTKVGCLRICEAGPTGVVYPDGTWYGCLTPANIDRVVEQHLIGGNEVEDLVIGRNPLPNPRV